MITQRENPNYSPGCNACCIVVVIIASVVLIRMFGLVP